MVARNRVRQGHRPEPGARGNGNAARRPLPRPPGTFAVRWPRLRAHFRQLCAVQVDRLRLVAADASLRLMAGSILVLTIAAVTTMATAMTLLGLAGGLSVLLDDRLWLAAILVGVGAFATTLAAVWATLRWRAHNRLAQLRRRHEPEPVATDTPAPAAAENGSPHVR